MRFAQSSGKHFERSGPSLILSDSAQMVLELREVDFRRLLVLSLQFVPVGGCFFAKEVYAGVYCVVSLIIRLTHVSAKYISSVFGDFEFVIRVS